jgi:hypothetical protein
MKIVINACHGGFGLSKAAMEEFASRKGITLGKYKEPWGYFEDFSSRDIERNDSVLVEIVERLGPLASGECAELEVVEIPDDVEWTIAEYDGREWVAEAHRTWN